MRRRQFVGCIGAGLASGVAGCLGGNSNTGEDGQATPTATSQPTFEPVSGGPMNADELPADEEPADGLPPDFDSTPPSRDLGSAQFGTLTVNPESFQVNDPNGVVVQLVPIDVAYYWYWDRSARFVDARAPGGFENSHVFGAVSSPAPLGRETDDPVAEWAVEDRIVCYCGCPHHLSGMRAGVLINEGYERVYVIDEGFWEWQERGYPMAGDEVSHQPALRVIDGLAAPRRAGDPVWAIHRPTNQLEAAPIRPDGTYRLELRFADVTADSIVTVKTPDYSVSAPIRVLTAGVVTG